MKSVPFGAADRGLAASALTAVNVEELTCHERGALQVEHSANDDGDATHPSQWMHTRIDGVRVVGVHRRVDDCRTCDQTVYGPPLDTHCTALDGPATVRLSTQRTSAT